MLSPEDGGMLERSPERDVRGSRVGLQLSWGYGHMNTGVKGGLGRARPPQQTPRLQTGSAGSRQRRSVSPRPPHVMLPRAGGSCHAPGQLPLLLCSCKTQPCLRLQKTLNNSKKQHILYCSQQETCSSPRFSSNTGSSAEGSCLFSQPRENTQVILSPPLSWACKYCKALER